MPWQRNTDQNETNKSEGREDMVGHIDNHLRSRDFEYVKRELGGAVSSDRDLGTNPQENTKQTKFEDILYASNNL